MSKLPLPAILLTVLLPAAILSQTSIPATQLSPKAAYDDAIHPLELTRHSVSNWSDTEVAALTVSMAHAKVDCAARDPKKFVGSDLIDFAKLCCLGQSSLGSSPQPPSTSQARLRNRS